MGKVFSKMIHTTEHVHVEEDFKYDDRGQMHGDYFTCVAVGGILISEIYGTYTHGDRSHNWAFVDFENDTVTYTKYENNEPTVMVTKNPSGSTHIRWLK